MEACLLFIAHDLPDLSSLPQALTSSLGQDGLPASDGILTYHVSSIEEGEALLFERSPSLLVVDDRVEGVLDFVRSLKADEMFRFLPVLVLAERAGLDGEEAFFTAQVDGILHRPFDGRALFHAVRPLIRTKLLTDDMQSRLARLQEDSIKNFILLDLVKRYIPKTVWDIACRFAEEQNIRIPEAEEEVTIVYGDILGFTAISQYLRPRDVIGMLNEAYDIVTRIVYEFEGDIDKFIGDAFLAVFTEPKPALLAAVRIQRALCELNAARTANALTPIVFRIGVHTGPVIRGNVGGELRNDNTLIGDAVNTAARIEAAAPPGEVLATEQACRRAGIEIPECYRTEQRVKGKDEPIVSYNIFRYACDTGLELESIQNTRVM